MYHLAGMLTHVDPPNYARARSLYELAETDRALTDLASLDVKGLGGSPDIRGAITRLQQAVDHGSAKACPNLAAIYLGDQKGMLREFMNQEEGRRMVEQAGEMREPKCLLMLATMLLREAKDPNLKPKEVKAMLLIKKAADRGDISAMNNYGQLRMLRLGLCNDPHEAITYLIKSAEGVRAGDAEPREIRAHRRGGARG
jgi:TPR repeat protein